MANRRDRERFGRKLRDERERANITMTVLAQHLEISIPYLSDIERGNRAPLDPAKIRLAAKVLAIDPNELLREAAISRGVFELDANLPTKHREVGAMLMRGWADLTDEELNAIAAVLNRRHGDGRDGSQ